MTTLDSQSAVCAVCGSVSTQMAIGSSNMLEAPDLDTRPGEMMRSTMPYWVQECPECGYAAPELHEADGRAAPIIRSDEYQALRTDAALPPLTRRFLLYALLLERLDMFPEAGWSTLHAAWAADDAGDALAARQARDKTLLLWQAGKQRGANFSEDHPSEFALVTDLYRRAGRFEDAREAANTALDTEELPPLIEDLLRYELVLIQRKDADRHSLGDLPSQGKPGSRIVMN
jgi:hypothetical protein